MDDKSFAVSVIIPTYERPQNLMRAIESVLCQDYRDVEVIVVDDNGLGSHWQIETEKLLLQKINRNQIKYICHEKNKNGSAARNTGFRNSKGEFIIFLDDDDTLSEDRVSEGIDTLVKNNNYGACYCDTIFVNGNKEFKYINKQYANPIEALLLGKMKFNTSSIIFRRSVLKELGGFDETFFRHQDYEIYIRYFRNHNIIKSERCFVKKYHTPNVVSKNPLKSIDYREKLISTFKNDILSWEQGNTVISCQYMELARVLAKYGYLKECVRYILKASKYRMPKFKSVAGIVKQIITKR